MVDVFRPVVFPEALSRQATRDRGYVTPAAQTDFFEQRNAAGDQSKAVFNLSHLLKDEAARADINGFLDNMLGGATSFLFKWFPEHLNPANRNFIRHIQSGDALIGTTTALQLRRSSPVNLVGTAQAGGAASITLAASQNQWLDHAVDDTYNTKVITITAGTGSNQVRVISDYIGASKVATVTPAWGVTPDGTSVYALSLYNHQKTITNPDWRETLTIYANDSAKSGTMDYRTGLFTPDSNWLIDTVITWSGKFLYKVTLESGTIRETDRYLSKSDHGPFRFREILPPLGT